MNEFPNLIFGICHGKTESILFNDLITRYVSLKFEELDFGWDGQVSPSIKYLDNARNACNVTVNNYENDVKKFFFSKNRNYQVNEILIEGANKILFVSLVDINEREQKPERYKKLVEDEGHREILHQLLDESNIETIDRENMLDSLFIYFDGCIEECLPSYETLKSKEKSMKKWISKIDMLENYSSEGIKEFISNAKDEKTNILSLFEYIDELFSKLIENLLKE